MVEQPGREQGWDPMGGEGDADDDGDAEEARERDVLEDDAADE